MENFKILNSQKNMLIGSIIINFIFVVISAVYLSTLFSDASAVIGGSVVFVIAFIVTTVATVLVIKNPSKGNVTFGYVATVIGFLILNKIGPILMLVAFLQINKLRKESELADSNTQTYTQQPTTNENTEEKNVFEQN